MKEKKENKILRIFIWIIPFLFIFFGVFVSGIDLTGKAIASGENLSYVSYTGFVLIFMGILVLIFLGRKKIGRIRDLEGQMTMFSGVSKPSEPEKSEIDDTPDYVGFVKKVEGMGIPEDKFEWTDTKKKLVRESFPGMYFKQGMSKYSNRRMGEAFSNLLKDARKYVKENS